MARMKCAKVPTISGSKPAAASLQASNQAPINLEEGNEMHIEVRRTAGAGFGLFAINDISAGTCLIAESSLLVMDYTSIEESGVDEAALIEANAHMFCDAVDQTPEENIAEIDKLYFSPCHLTMEACQNIHNWFKKPYADMSEAELLKEGKELQNAVNSTARRFAISETNAITMSPDVDAAGIFRLTSRINHKCTPNADAGFHADTNKMEVYAVRDLDKDEQIFLDYTGFSCRPRSHRRFELLMRWGFVCECASCEYEEFDEDRKRMFELDCMLELYDKNTLDPELEPPSVELENDGEALAAAQELKSLLRGYDLYGWGLVSACYFAAKYALKCGDAETALDNARERLDMKKNLGHREAREGYDPLLWSIEMDVAAMYRHQVYEWKEEQQQ